MAIRVRVLEQEDVAAVAALHARVYPGHGWTTPEAHRAYFREMLFENPWRDPEIPSWVADDRGRVVGCYTVMPRPMCHRGRPVRAAIGWQMIVDPDARQSLAALQLTRACLQGPQDLTLADGANEDGRRLWRAAGGHSPLLYGLHWTRPLRPAKYAVSLASRHHRLAARALAPLAALGDCAAALLRPNRFLREDDGWTDEPLESGAMLAQLPEFFGGYALQPRYDAASLPWLLEQVARKKRHGPLRARLVRDPGGAPAGWFLYYLNPGGIGEVMQLAAARGRFADLLRRLLADAWREGAAVLRGRLEPRHAEALSLRHCWLRIDSTWTLVHSRRAELSAAFAQGDAFLSRLDGEWWLRHNGC